MSPARSRSRLGKYIAAAGLLILLAGGAAAVVVVIIRDPQGKKIAEVQVPKGGTVEIKPDAVGAGLPRSAPKNDVRIAPAPLAPMQPGEPLSPMALVQQPAKLPGVRSWTLAPRETWNPNSVAYRPDGKRLAVGSWDWSIHIWEPETGRLMQVLYSQGTVMSLAWSPDGRVLAQGTGLFKRCLHLWDGDSGRLLRTLEAPVADFIRALAWSPDGRTVRGWGEVGERCYTWEADGGKLLHAPHIAGKWPAFSSDGQRLASTVGDNRVLIWDADTGKEVSRLSAPASVYRLGWSPDGKRLACTGQDGLRVWDVETRKEIFHHKKTLSPNETPSWSPDGRSLVFGVGQNGIDGVEVIAIAPAAEPRRLDDFGGSDTAWSPDGTTIARTNGWPWVRLYDAATGKRQRTLTDGRPIAGFAWSPDTQTLAVADVFDTFLTSADTGQVFAEVQGATWPSAWSPDGKQLAAAGLTKEVLLRGSDGTARHALIGHEAATTSLAWSPDSKRLASTAAGEKRVLLWDADKGQRDRELGPFPGVAESVKWSADGRLVTFNVADVGWHVWDVEKNRLVNDPKQWKVFWFDLTPDGRSALVAPSATEEYRLRDSETEEYRLRDLASGKDGARLPHRHGKYQAHPIWSPDGRLLAVSTVDGIELWRSDLGKRLRILPRQGGAAHMSFSRDGKRVAAQNGERLHVWETDTGRLRGILVLGTRYNGLTLTPDGHYTGNENVELGIVMVVQKDDGTQELLEPADFKRKYDFQNDPAKVRLTDK